MVYLKTIKRGGKTYYYLCKSYANKFGKRFERNILTIKPNEVNVRLDQLKKQAEELVNTIDYYENLFEMCLSKYKKIKGKNVFINHLIEEKRLGQELAESYWERSVSQYTKITGNNLYADTILPKKKKRGPVPLPPARKTKHITINAPTGTIRTLWAISFKLFEKLSVSGYFDAETATRLWNNCKIDQKRISNTDSLKQAIKWGVIKLAESELVTTDQHYYFQNPRTGAEIVKIPIYRRYGHTRLYRSFRLKRNDYKRIRGITKAFKLHSTNSAVIHAITLYGTFLGVAKSYFCMNDTPTKEKKRGKYHIRVRCRLDHKLYLPSYCLTCPNWR